MRLVHLSDLHLGFRQYQRLTAAGMNQREADIASTLERTAAQVTALAPELIVIAGDVFHSVRPSNPAILHAFRILQHWRVALPDTKIVMVAGNHDAPRTSETGCILGLFREIGIHVADSEAVTFSFPELQLTVLAVPDVPGMVRPPLVPPDGFRHRVLLMHGETAGLLPHSRVARQRGADIIPIEDLRAASWSYVALGHYHVYRRIASNAWYSGSLDYTSSNPWSELDEERESRIPGKGFIEHDLTSGRHLFHPVKPSRRLVDLEAIEGAGMSAAELDRAIALRIEAAAGGIDQAIVRMRLYNVPRHVMRELDHAALREYRKRAMHLNLDSQRPVAQPLSAAERKALQRNTLSDVVSKRLGERELRTDVNRDALVALGEHYLKLAEESMAGSMAGSMVGAAEPPNVGIA